MTRFKDDAKETFHFLGLGAIAWFVIIALFAVTGLGIWGFRVLTSEARGQGDAIIQKNSAQNWLAAQKRFEDNYAEIEATQFKIEAARPKIADGSATEEEKIRFEGLRSYCGSVVADYNADARDYLQEDFRAADLPPSLDPTQTCS